MNGNLDIEELADVWFYPHVLRKLSNALRARLSKRRALALLALFVVSFACFFTILWHEVKSSSFQAYFLSRFTKTLTYKMEPGEGPPIPFPRVGPYDERLGYTLMPLFLHKLLADQYGFEITSQARLSAPLRNLIRSGIFPIYKEKTQAGLHILDRTGKTAFQARYPERIYPDFESIPKAVLNSLLFIENRELFDPRYPKRNPAVEWDRFAKAVTDLGQKVVRTDHKVVGGSTIATQLEKYRHSSEGRTARPGDKIQQMVSASIRAYLSGENTEQARRDLVLNYINSIPLAASGNYGEVNGLGDGLWAWYDADFDQVNQLLSTPDNLHDEKLMAAKSRAYIQVLSLFLAHRRPTSLLGGGRKELETLVRSHLNLMLREEIISKELYQLASTTSLPFRKGPIPPAKISFLDRKGTNLVRSELLSLLGLRKLYQVDRLDLTVKTALDVDAQFELTKTLKQLVDPKFLRDANLLGSRVLDQGKDPGLVIYSFTLYEKGEGKNLLRIETDSYDQPLNINQGAKLDLGSTAKLRTLITYLEIVSDLHKEFSSKSSAELKKTLAHSQDKISRWAFDYLAAAKDKSLTAMLEASMDRTYSASPGEVFFTGGGQHTFENFNKEDNGKSMPLRNGFRHSVNLVFIRLMRDIVYHYMYRDAPLHGDIFKNKDHPKRRYYLERFADLEGKEFMAQFLPKYLGKSRSEILDALFKKTTKTPKRYAAVYRAFDPQAKLPVFAEFMRSRFPSENLSDEAIQKLHEQWEYGIQTLNDRGYIANLHPLEVWTANYLYRHQRAGRGQVIRSAYSARLESYSWLLNSNKFQGQNTRIKILLEQDAFQDVLRAWRRVGYPFRTIIPSYATSIGSSADRPAALATLMGIIVNDGMRLPSTTIEELHFADGTPYETDLRARKRAGQRVLQPEVTTILKTALQDIVENGTAQRVKGAFVRPDKSIMPVGGKTGTGDHRFKVYGAGRQLVASKVMNRTATFVFFIDNRFFGTITAYVPGEAAAKYHFTSALPVQLLKYVSTALLPYINRTDKASVDLDAADAAAADKLEQQAPLR